MAQQVRPLKAALRLGSVRPVYNSPLRCILYQFSTSGAQKSENLVLSHEATYVSVPWPDSCSPQSSLWINPQRHIRSNFLIVTN